VYDLIHQNYFAPNATLLVKETARLKLVEKVIFEKIIVRERQFHIGQ
jgi:hypothetical protein